MRQDSSFLDQKSYSSDLSWILKSDKMTEEIQMEEGNKKPTLSDYLRSGSCIGDPKVIRIHLTIVCYVKRNILIIGNVSDVMLP